MVQTALPASEAWDRHADLSGQSDELGEGEDGLVEEGMTVRLWCLHGWTPGQLSEPGIGWRPSIIPTGVCAKDIAPEFGGPLLLTRALLPSQVRKLMEGWAPNAPSTLKSGDSLFDVGGLGTEYRLCCGLRSGDENFLWIVVLCEPSVGRFPVYVHKDDRADLINLKLAAHFSPTDFPALLDLNGNVRSGAHRMEQLVKWHGQQFTARVRRLSGPVRPTSYEVMCHVIAKQVGGWRSTGMHILLNDIVKQVQFFLKTLFLDLREPRLCEADKRPIRGSRFVKDVLKADRAVLSFFDNRAVNSSSEPPLSVFGRTLSGRESGITASPYETFHQVMVRLQSDLGIVDSKVVGRLPSGFVVPEQRVREVITRGQEELLVTLVTETEMDQAFRGTRIVDTLGHRILQDSELLVSLVGDPAVVICLLCAWPEDLFSQ